MVLFSGIPLVGDARAAVALLLTGLSDVGGRCWRKVVAFFPGARPVCDTLRGDGILEVWLAPAVSAMVPIGS